jgi:hypothetical protein
MADDTEPQPDDMIPANDNQGPESGRMNQIRRRGSGWIRLILTIARLIGRRIAREPFAALGAANDDRAKDVQDAQDGTGKE